MNKAIIVIGIILIVLIAAVCFCSIAVNKLVHYDGFLPNVDEERDYK